MKDMTMPLFKDTATMQAIDELMGYMDDLDSDNLSSPDALDKLFGLSVTED